MSTVLVLVEHTDGELARTSRETLTLARNLTEPVDGRLEVAAVGTWSDELRKEAAAFGVTAVHTLEHELLDPDAPPAAVAEAVRQLMDVVSPTVVLGAASERGTPAFAHLAARTDLPLAANCTAVETVDDGWELTRLRWGGVLYEDAHLDAEVALLTVAPHQVAAVPATMPGAADLEPFTPELDEALTVARPVAREALSGGISLATAPVVLAGGRGMGSAEGFAVLEELAALLGGAVGCSRVATNAGWRSHNDQVGQTGTRVAPDLYLACGISGATQHWVGCMNAKRIIAVNTDAEAPMVTRAHEAVLGDLHEFLPALLEEVRARKGG